MHSCRIKAQAIIFSFILTIGFLAACNISPVQIVGTAEPSTDSKLQSAQSHGSKAEESKLEDSGMQEEISTVGSAETGSFDSGSASAAGKFDEQRRIKKANEDRLRDSEGKSAPAETDLPETIIPNAPLPSPKNATSGQEETPSQSDPSAAQNQTTAAGSNSDSSVDLVALADEVFRLVNAERESKGLAPLTKTTELTQTAVVRAVETISRFSHVRPDGRSCFTAFDENKVPYKKGGENIGKGQISPSEIVTAWMDSPGHKGVILNGDYKHTGVGVAMDSKGLLYWAQSFTD